MDDQDMLTEELERHAARFEAMGGRELDVAQVLGRAGRIRRRRRGTTALVAAAVAVAVAVPTALAVGGQQAQRPTPTTHHHTTHHPDTVAPLGLGDLPAGPEPATGFVAREVWHAPDGSTLRLPANLRQPYDAAPVPGGVVLAQGSKAYLVRTGHGARPLGRIAGGLASSPERHVVAFAGPRGAVTAVQGDGEVLRLSSVDSGSGFDAVAVTGEDCRATAHDGCTVWVDANGRVPRAWASFPRGHSEVAGPRIIILADVSGTGLHAGMTRVSDFGSCSEVQRQGRRLWHTCKARFKSFSPDGDRLLGSSAYGDGFGDTSLNVRDARTGRLQLALRTRRDVAITSMGWEDDDHLLAVISDQRRWAVVRIGMDGHAEYALPPVRGGVDQAAPYVVATR